MQKRFFFGKTKSYLNDGGVQMRFSEKAQTTLNGGSQVLGVDFHDFIQKEQTANLVELASEFEVNVRKIKNLKKNINQ